jgi:hypothetical protein
MPKTISGEVIKRVFDRGPVIVFANDRKVPSECLDKLLAQKHFISRDDTFVQQVQDREQENRLVWALMEATFVATQVVQSLKPGLPRLLCGLKSH